MHDGNVALSHVVPLKLGAEVRSGRLCPSAHHETLGLSIETMTRIHLTAQLLEESRAEIIVTRAV